MSALFQRFEEIRRYIYIVRTMMHVFADYRNLSNKVIIR